MKSHPFLGVFVSDESKSISGKALWAWSSFTSHSMRRKMMAATYGDRQCHHGQSREYKNMVSSLRDPVSFNVTYDILHT